MTFFIGIQNNGMALIIGSRIHGSQLMQNLPNHPRQYSKCQIRVGGIEKCLDEGLEPTYHFSIFTHCLDNR